ncbi:N-acetyltransferase B complex non catalytic subunit-domain-containing protein [Nemania sp. NC0429]|nr:N-acetyltransferase B complex non catalytic subunit-domain-containing protein [Nemania sp. NC0429]
MSLQIAPVPRAVQLKHSVDIQLDHAFHEQQWTILANLARQRHKATKDEYYRAVEIAAKSRGDNAIDRTLGREVVQAMVNDNTVMKDVDALDLYEFAVDRLSIDYSKTIGVLRARLAKALPKDQSVGLKCLEACMWYSDWENAQEIAVSLNKNFPGDRKLLFQNILTTFLVGAAENTNAVKKKLFPNLVKAQVDRAFNLRPLTGKEQTPPGHVHFSENEIKLWIRIREKFGSPQENVKLLSLPNWGTLYFLEQGFTDAFLLSIRLLAFNLQWEAILQISNTVFDKVIEMEQHNPIETVTSSDNNQNTETPATRQRLVEATNSSPGRASEEFIKGQYLNASREWLLWKNTTTAASNLPNSQEALETFHKKIENVIRILSSMGRMNPIFQQNYSQILLDITFTRARTATYPTHSRPAENKTIQCLLKFAKENIKNPSCFATLKGYFELLSREEMASFANALGDEYTKDTEGLDLYDRLFLAALTLRVKFFEATSLTKGEECRFCYSVATDGTGCESCLESITKDTLDAFRLGIQDQAVSRKAADATEDPLSNLAILGSICLVKLAGLGRRSWRHMGGSPLYHADIQLFLQAVIWLEFYLKKAPNSDSVRFMLVKLYLMMGSVTRALEVWSIFDVKNTLLECLGTVCLDRLATISPSSFVPGPGHLHDFAEPFIHHFETAIQKKYPDTVVKTLQNSSYAELPNVVDLAQNQSRNCVVVLAVVENRRGIRLKSGRNETAIEDEPLIRSISPEYTLQDFTDYNPLPHWAGSRSTPIQELAAHGPLPTNRRCHLSLLAERFLDLVCYIQPKDFKPSKTVQVLQIDWQAAASSCKKLHKNLDAFLYGEGHDEDDLTGPETWFFRTVAELAKLVTLVLETVLPASSTKAAREDILAVIRRILAIMDYHIHDFLSAPAGLLAGAPAKLHTFHSVAALHAMGMLRESTLAVKYTVQHVTLALERVKAIDKPRGVSEAAWLIPETKKLAAAAVAADAKIKARVAKLTESLHTSGWVDCLVGWALGGDGDGVGNAANGGFAGATAQKLALFIPEDAREVWAADIADSWRDVVKGWAAVRLE